MSEMHEPRDFPKALAMLQVPDTVRYVVVAIVIYRYSGHVACKYIYVPMFRGSLTTYTSAVSSPSERQP